MISLDSESKERNMTTRNTCSVFVAAAAIFSCGGVLADNVENEPRYLSVECMKSTSPEYQSIEIDVWLPMHQEMVEQRKQERWALYWVKYGDRSRCDYYTVTTYVGSAQLNAVPSFDEVFKVAHPRGDFTKAMVRTGASRQHVASELWQMVDAIPSNQHRFAIVNRMNAADPDAYERMETRVFKPGHEALVDGGYRAGWAMYALVSPLGSSIPYNYSTVDLVDHLDPVPMAQAMMSANPERDLDALQALLALREQVSSETWELIAATEPRDLRK